MQMSALRKRTLFGQMHFYVFWRAIVRFYVEGHSRAASSLTLATLLALVPMMAIALALVQILPFFSPYIEQLQHFIFQHFVPSTSETIETYLDQFATQSQNLTRFGSGFLFVTAVLLLVNIETSIGDIWHTITDPHAWYWRIIKHIAIIILFPTLMAASIVLSSYFLSKDSMVQQAFLPFMATYAALFFMYKIVPNCKVHTRDALWGTTIAAALFEVMKYLFKLYLLYFPTYEILYGALSVLPILILWLYLSWAIVLYGAMITHELSYPQGDAKRA